MSAYKIIKTTFKVGESLEKALADLVIQFEKGQNLKVNGVILRTSWGSAWGGNNQEVSLAVNKIEANRVGIGRYDGIGFRWNGAGYDLVQDHYDENNEACSKVISQLKQRYTYHEVRRQARAAAIQQQAEIERQAKWESTRVEKLQSTLLEEQYAHQRRMNQLEEIERGEKIEAMRIAEAEHARQQLQQIASPFQEVFQALRSQLAKDAKEMLESIKKNGSVRGKVAERGRGLIELFDLLFFNFENEPSRVKN